jgi:hypothetical protein
MKFAKHPSLLLLSLLGVAQSELKDQCGDCWCIYDGELAACPADPTGIVDSFDDSNVILRTFELTNDPDFLKLQTADGQECYPFADSVGPINRYPKSNLPQCAMPVSTDETVCAYLYGAEETCSGRSYQVLTYDSAAAAAAVEAGAVVTHKDGEFLILYYVRVLDLLVFLLDAWGSRRSHDCIHAPRFIQLAEFAVPLRTFGFA